MNDRALEKLKLAEISLKKIKHSDELNKWLLEV